MSRQFDRRKFLAGGLATAGGALALGTGVDLGLAGVAGASGKGNNGISTAKPKKGGRLIFGVDAEEQGFNPTTARFDEVGVMYARTVFDPLTIVTRSGTVVPYLAKSVVPNAEYTQWTITLRPGLKFHDGTPCDAAAVVANLEAQYASLLTGSVLVGVVEKTNGFVQTGPLTVQVNMIYPWVPFDYYLAGQIGGQIGYIAAPSMLNAPNGGTDTPIGTGPFKFQEWVPNDHFTAVKNDEYWRPGYPYLDSITYRPLPDEDSRVEALQAGTIDIMITDTPQTVKMFRGNHQWSYVDDSGPVIGEPDMNCIMLNCSIPPFNNPKARLAAAKALSSKQYSEVIDIGIDAPSYGPFVSGTPYYATSNYPAYDPSEATKLVKELKSEGASVSFALGSTPDAPTIRANSYRQQALNAVGFDVTISQYQQNELINNALSGKEFQAYGWRQFGAVNPDMNYIFWSPTTIIPGLSINMARNNDPQLQKALLQGRSSPSAAVRAKAYQTVAKRLNVDLPYLWSDRAVWAVVAKPSVQNFNNPSAPSGTPAKGLIAGSVWPTQIWMS